MSLVCEDQGLVSLETLEHSAQVLKVDGLALGTVLVFDLGWDPVSRLLQPVVADVDQEMRMALSHTLVEEKIFGLVNFRDVLWRGREIIDEHALAILLQISEPVVHHLVIISHQRRIDGVGLDDALLKESLKSFLFSPRESDGWSQVR